MDGIRISAKTVDEAITKALIEMQITSDKLDYEVVEKGSAGIFGVFGTKQAVIVARKKKDIEQPDLIVGNSEEKPEKSLKADKPSRESKPLKEAYGEKEAKPEKITREFDSKAIEESAVVFLNQIFKAMNITVQINTSFSPADKELSVDMTGDDMGILIGKRGQTLDSLQYLVSLVVNKDNDGYLRVKLDTENYRARRKDTLETLAKNIAYKVKRTKKAVSLEPMNPYERRIIHAALQNDKYVLTRSEGEDPFRHVVISLKREGSNKRDRY